MTSTEGLTGLTIGSLADRLRMSKSGLFAHFGSKEQLQLAVLEHAAEVFTEEVFRPALAQPTGLPRIEALFDNWIAWSKSSKLPGGCPIQGASIEFDDRPGPIRDFLALTQERLMKAIGGAVQRAIDAGHLRPDMDVERFAFEFVSLSYGFGLTYRLMHHPRAEEMARKAFADILDRARLRPVSLDPFAWDGRDAAGRFWRTEQW
ncbi:TetR/AcrR family transcriptional regulator [Indioceanicola profundi]|uniref:TetR/AcrR family transcriptional regulator n=1 Tax=Indioceanicola profundi TaxID=2220096 RepID=UPI00196918E9